MNHIVVAALVDGAQFESAGEQQVERFGVTGDRGPVRSVGALAVVDGSQRSATVEQVLGRLERVSKRTPVQRRVACVCNKQKRVTERKHTAAAATVAPDASRVNSNAGSPSINS